MPNFDIKTIENAKPESAKMLAAAKQNFGFVPNLLGAFAEAPAALEGYITMMGIFSKTSFSETEQQVVLMTSNFENNCSYCMAAHSILAAMGGMPEEVLAALRNNTPMPDKKLSALREFTRSVVTTRGYPTEETTNDFYAAGYSNQQALEVVLGVAVKTLSNYANHLANTPLDEAFSKAKWSK